MGYPFPYYYSPLSFHLCLLRDRLFYQETSRLSMFRLFFSHPLDTHVLLHLSLLLLLFFPSFPHLLHLCNFRFHLRPIQFLLLPFLLLPFLLLLLPPLLLTRIEER